MTRESIQEKVDILMGDRLVKGFDAKKYADFGVYLLQNDYDSENIRILAGLDRDDSETVDRYFNHIANELGFRTNYENAELYRIYARHLALQVLRGEVDPESGVHFMYHIFLNSDYDREFSVFMYLDDALASLKYGEYPHTWPEMNLKNKNEIVKKTFENLLKGEEIKYYKTDVSNDNLTRMEEGKMKIYKTEIPADSLTRQFMPADYEDAFACDVVGADDLSADDIQVSSWTRMPAWVNVLFKLRNGIVRLAGLKGGNLKDRTAVLEAAIRSGGGMDMVSVPAKSDNETVLKLSDKHLDAFMSVHIVRTGSTQTVTAITLVHFHNILGRIYFFFIRPFHKPVVKIMLKSTLQKMIVTRTS